MEEIMKDKNLNRYFKCLLNFIVHPFKSIAFLLYNLEEGLFPYHSNIGMPLDSESMNITLRILRKKKDTLKNINLTVAKVNYLESKNLEEYKSKGQKVKHKLIIK